MIQQLEMLLRRATGQTPVIGVDIGREALRMLQLETEPGQPPQVIAAARRDLRSRLARLEPSSDPSIYLGAAAEAIADLLRRDEFVGRRIVAAIPRSLPQFRTLRLHVSDPAELPRLVAREARSALGIDVTTGKYVVHFLPGDVLRRSADTHQEGLLVVVRKRDVEQFLAMLHDCGAEVVALDLEPMSLYRSVQRYARRRRDAQDVQVLVDLGTRSTQVVIGRAGRIGFHKSISIGTDSVHAAIARKLDLSAVDAAAMYHKLEQQVREASRSGDTRWLEKDPLHRAAFNAARATIEDLSRELALCLRYYCITFRCKRPDRVLLCGTAAEDPRLRAALAAGLPVPVEPRQPLLDIKIPPSCRQVMQCFPEEWTIALGLALRFTPPGIAGKAGISRDVQTAADTKGDQDSDAGATARRGISSDAAAPAGGNRAGTLIAGRSAPVTGNDRIVAPERREGANV